MLGAELRQAPPATKFSISALPHLFIRLPPLTVHFITMGKGKNHDRKAGNPGFGKQKLKSSTGEKSEFTMKRIKGECLLAAGRSGDPAATPPASFGSRPTADPQVKTSTCPRKMPRARRC